MSIQFLWIGDLKGKRIHALKDTLKDFEIKDIKLFSWKSIIKDLSVLEKHFKDETIIRMEPPEKDMEIYRQFLLKSCEDDSYKRQILKMDFSRYTIVDPKKWYKGFCYVLKQINEMKTYHKDKNMVWMNDCNEMMRMMDKSKTYDTLKNHEENAYFHLPSKIYVPTNYEEFKDLYGNKFLKCFIKLRYGSGSTGILAYENHPKRKEQKLYTSLNFEKKENKNTFFSQYRVQCFRERKSIQTLIGWVLKNGAHIEQWIPKSTYKGYAFDTRALVVDKKCVYRLSRLSKSPITNLHLKNRRRESETFLSKDALMNIQKASEDVMKVFKNSLYAGVDVVTSKSYTPYIIDVNPFGDLFHHLIGTDKNVYELEFKKAIQRLRRDTKDEYE